MVDKKKVDNLAKDIKLFEEDTDKSLISLLMRSGMTKEEATKYHMQSKKTVKAKGGMVEKKKKSKKNDTSGQLAQNPNHGSCQ